MNQSLWKRILAFLKRKMWNRRWQRAVTCLAAVAVFATTYALVLPAITMTKTYPTLQAEETIAWSGDELAVKVNAASEPGEAGKTIVLTAEGEGADLSGLYVFDESGVCVIRDDAGRDIELHRSIREEDVKNAKGEKVNRIDYWFSLAAGEETSFTLQLIDEVDETRFAETVKAVKESSEEAAEKATASDAGKSAAAQTGKKGAVAASASNAKKATNSNAAADAAEANKLAAKDEEKILTEKSDEDSSFVEILDGAVVNDLEPEADEDEEQTEVVANLKLSAGIGEDYEGAVRDAEKNANKRAANEDGGVAELLLQWQDVIAQKAAESKLVSYVNGATIAVFYNNKAEIPEGASLEVSEIEEGSEEYAAYLAQSKSAVANATASDASKEVTQARFFDITIVDEDGEEVEPQSAVKVVITYDEAVSISDEGDMNVVHFKEAETPEVFKPGTVEGGTEVGGLSFTTDSFSVYGIVGMGVLKAQCLTADGKTLKITVNYDENAQIPDGAELKVKEISESDESWTDRSVRLASVLSEKYGNYYISDARFLDISIMVDGKEFEPKTPVEIKVEYTDPMRTEYIVDSVDTDPNKRGEFAGFEDKTQMTTHFAVVHYEDNKPNILDAEIKQTENLITESVTVTPGFSAYDFVNVDVYEAREAEYSSLSGTIGTLKASDIVLNAAEAPATRNAGDVPNHSKSLRDNRDGTYTIGLNVEGDAETTSVASNVNVLIVYDVSSSMTIYHAPSETGRYGAPSSTYGTDYSTLYQMTGNNSYSALNNDNYSGDVYTRTRRGNRYYYNLYTGQRYSAQWRADVAEKTIYDFTHALFGYQNADKDNINAAVVTFDASAHSLPRNNLPVTWTQTESDISQYFNSSGTSHTNALYGSGTNWEAALDAASNAVDAITNDYPTYVVFITDGAPTNRNGTTDRDVELCYEAAQNEARSVYNATTESGGGFFGIYAYGEEADWLASLMYYAYNNAEPGSDVRGTTFDTDGYYNAASTTALTEAINEIFQKIVQTLGVTAVSIADGTTSNVATSTGMAHLLVVDNSFQYWLSIPVTDGSEGYTFIMPNKTTGEDVTYTVTPDGENVTISWPGGSATYAGSVNLNTLTIEWTAATSFYNYNPPAASYNSTTGAVEWNLHPVGTLLDGVTYTVTFDCYPSQETLDLIADLKNGDVLYSDLDPAIQEYLTEDYQLKTNTTATLSYTDTRPGGMSDTIEYVNPDPQPVSATELVTVSKIWSNTLDGRTGWQQELELFVTRDGVEGHAVDLTRANNWTNTAWISYGILTEDENGIHVKTSGHDYSFSEDVETGYNWEIKAPTVRPMLIGTTITMLKLVDAADAPDAIKNASGDNAKATVGDDTYYKLTIDEKTEYYVVVEDVNSALTATNHRRSYLDVVKTVTGNNVPKDDVFAFTMKVNNANAETANPDDVNSDSWVWFSIYDTINSALVTDPDAATAAGIRWQLNGDDGTVVTEKPASEDFNGYFCVSSGISITAHMKNGYSLRFLNLPEKTTYEISESEIMPADGYSFVSIVGQRGYDEDGSEDTTDDWTTETAGTVSGQSISGTIEYTESAYKATVTNKWSSVDVKLEKVKEDGETAISGSVFDLKRLSDGAWSEVQTDIAPGGTYTSTDDSGIETTGTYGNPIDLGGLGLGRYCLTETTAPDGYIILTKNVYFEVYKDNGDLKVRLTDEDGTVKEQVDGVNLSSETVDDELIYTVTVSNTPGKELPSTGGPGTVPYTLSGLMLLIASALLYGFRMRRGERRLM